MYCTAEFKGELPSLFMELSLQSLFYAVSLSFSQFSTTKISVPSYQASARACS